MKESLRHSVRERARQRCEYCQLPDRVAPVSSFHVEHIVAKQHQGSDDPVNRCWSCHRCNLCKGPNLSGKDPITGKVVRLFNPRRQRWKRHFQWKRAVLMGLTAAGRATIHVLDINHPQRVRLRQELMDAGEWPFD